MAYDIVTAGDLSIVGAHPSTDLEALLAASSAGLASFDELDALDMAGVAGAAPNAGVQQAIMAQKLAQSSLLTRTDKPTKAREYAIGFLSAAPVAAGAQVQVVSRPQIVFRGERLLIPSDIAGQFQVDQIIVGKNPQQVSSNPLPGRVFDERGVGVRMQMDTAQISQDMVLLVTNIGGAPATFRAAIIGAAVE